MTGDPVTDAVFAERRRCARIVERSLSLAGSEADHPVQKAVDSVIRRVLRTCAEQIKEGLPPPVSKRSRKVCSYCDGEGGPEGHNRATCPRRFADLEAGKASS